MIGRHARSRGARHQPGSGHCRQAPGDPAGLVARRTVLLVSGRALLVEADQTEAWDRGEDCRPAPEHDLRLAAPRAPPLLSTLELGQLAVKHRDRRVKAGPDALHELRGERDVGDEQKHAQAFGQGLLCRSQINLRLAARDDPMKERHLVGADHLQRVPLLGGEVRRAGG